MVSRVLVAKLPLMCAMALVMALVCRAQNSPSDYLAAHNAARAEVGVGAMAWDATVAAYAQNYANQRANDCELVHSGGPYGENLFGGTGDWSASDAVADWVAEKQYYNYASNSCTGGECLHYTQVVWSNSVNLGCARMKCSEKVFIICSYSPAGNVQGQRPY